jgi:hypothetical protein
MSIWTSLFGPAIVIKVVFLSGQVRDYLITLEEKHVFSTILYD